MQHTGHDRKKEKIPKNSQTWSLLYCLDKKMIKINLKRSDKTKERYFELLGAANYKKTNIRGN